MFGDVLWGKKSAHIHFTTTPAQKQQVTELGENMELSLTETMRYIIAKFFAHNLNNIPDDTELDSSIKGDE